ncbi:MAG: GNAT family N-acetyltransferase [Pseudomonadota bacterium]
MTAPRTRWHVAPLDGKAHDRTGFSCGAPELDRYIRDYASQDIERDVARVFVATAIEAFDVAGYYSLSATSFRKTSLPAAEAKRLPHYPVPAALLGRLAVDRRQQGQGLGEHLLMDAFDRLHLASLTLAVQAIVVDAYDAGAAAFYRRYGFRPFLDDDRRLFLPMATIRQLIQR